MLSSHTQEKRVKMKKNKEKAKVVSEGVVAGCIEQARGATRHPKAGQPKAWLKIRDWH